MNFQILEKYNDFVKSIEDKYKSNIDLVLFNEQIRKEQITREGINKKENNIVNNKEIKFLNQTLYIDNCSCDISSDFISDFSSELKNSVKEKKLSNNDKITYKTNDEISKNMGEDLSLLEDDYFIGNKFSYDINDYVSQDEEYEECNNLSNEQQINKDNIQEKNMNKEIDNENKDINIYNQDKSEKTDLYTNISIKSEFKNLFSIGDIKLNNTNDEKNNYDEEINDKLENIYKKILTKKNKEQNQNNTQINIANDENNKLMYQLINYMVYENNYLNIDLTIKKISELLEFIFNESTRGWNYEYNVFVFNLEKLKENLGKIIFPKSTQISNEIKFGIIYRDFNEPKAYLDKNPIKYWIGFETCANENVNTNINISLEHNNLNNTKYSIKNKILFYCLKNLTKTNKFKKKISKWNYKFIKKTIQIYGQKKLLIDIILFVGIKDNKQNE